MTGISTPIAIREDKKSKYTYDVRAGQKLSLAMQATGMTELSATLSIGRKSN